ncbi:MAG: GSCFA domain-containing protein [Puia sp.]|nr:GSCFA domain-containing protein [Puia sp.]
MVDNVCFSLPGLAAMEAAVRNPYSRWDKIKGIGSDCFLPKLNPKFQIGKEKPVFAIGCCFSQGIQMALNAQGFDLITFREMSPRREFFMQQVAGESYHYPLHFFLRYSLASMAQEIDRILGDSVLNSDALFYKRDTEILDLHYNAEFPLSSMSDSIERRQHIREHLTHLKSAGLMIITLGLIEVWLDRETGLYLNAAPPFGALIDAPLRYQLNIMDWRTTYALAERMIDQILSANPELKIVLMVSPTMQDTTFAPNDLTVSSSHSKATLISVARELAYANSSVDYLPTWEMAALSDPRRVWEKDGRHTQNEFVQVMMTHFVNSYMSIST